MDPLIGDSLSRITSAGGYEADVVDLPFKIDAFRSINAYDQAQVRVDLQIDATKLGFRTLNDRHAGTLRIAIYYADGKRNYLGEEWKSVDLRLKKILASASCSSVSPSPCKSFSAHRRSVCPGLQICRG